MGKQSVRERILRSADLQEETPLAMPLVEIADHNRVLIENHKGVIQYASSSIRVRVKFGHICVCGREMFLLKMTKDQLIISGQIDSVHLIRG